jgi:hypothetical protein
MSKILHILLAWLSKQTNADATDNCAFTTTDSTAIADNNKIANANSKWPNSFACANNNVGTNTVANTATNSKSFSTTNSVAVCLWKWCNGKRRGM